MKQSLQNESKDDWKWKFYESDLSLGTSFKLFKDIAYSPTLSLTARYNYNPVYNSVDDKDIEKHPLTLTYNHGFGKNEVNWIGNFRDGFGYGIRNNLSLLFDNNKNVTPAGQINLGGKYYKAFRDFPIAFGFKVDGVASINYEMLGLGDRVRGVKSGNLYGEFGLFSNNNIYIRTIKIREVAEAIFAPFFDFGVTNNSRMRYGTGADFILYVDKLKSLVARGTIGWDLTDFSPMNFTIDITSSLFF